LSNFAIIVKTQKNAKIQKSLKYFFSFLQLIYYQTYKMSESYTHNLGQYINGGSDGTYEGGVSTGVIVGIGMLVAVIVVIVIVAVIMLTSENKNKKLTPTDSAGAGAAGAGAGVGAGAADAGAAATQSLVQKSRDFGPIVCPTGWTTKYNHAVNVAADCQQGKECNMCIGEGKGYPELYNVPITGLVKTWPLRSWKVPSADTSGYQRPSCSKDDGLTMGYQGGIYITTPLPMYGCP